MEARELKSIGKVERPARLITVPPTMAVPEGLALMHRHHIHHLMVIRRGKCLGVVSSRELVPAALHANWIGSARVMTVGEVMHHCGEPLDESTDVQTTLSQMIERGVTALPIAREGVITDIVTESDLLRILNVLLGNRSHSHLKDRVEASIHSPLAGSIISALEKAGI